MNQLLTNHALRRMQARHIAVAAIEAAQEYGREVHARGARIYAIGRRDIAYWSARGIDLSGYEGIQVVCAMDGSVLTTYRNRDFRSLRPGMGRGRHRPRV